MTRNLAKRLNQNGDVAAYAEVDMDGALGTWVTDVNGYETEPVPGLSLDQRKFVLVTEGPPRRPYHEVDIISRVLYQEGVPTNIRMFQLRRNARATLAGQSTPYAPVEQLLAFRDTIPRAARTVDPLIVDITANGTWRGSKSTASHRTDTRARGPTGSKNCGRRSRQRTRGRDPHGNGMVRPGVSH